MDASILTAGAIKVTMKSCLIAKLNFLFIFGVGVS